MIGSDDRIGLDRLTPGSLTPIGFGGSAAMPTAAVMMPTPVTIQVARLVFCLTRTSHTAERLLSKLAKQLYIAAGTERSVNGTPWPAGLSLPRKRQPRGVLAYVERSCRGERSGWFANRAFQRCGVSSATRLAG